MVTGRNPQILVLHPEIRDSTLEGAWRRIDHSIREAIEPEERD